MKGYINALKAKASYKALSSFFPSIRNARIHVWMDNMTLRAAWEMAVVGLLLNQELKKIEEMSRAGNFALHLKCIPSNKNITDAPSHTLSDIDCSLSEEVWARISSKIWATPFDLMSLDSNCRKGRDGLLPHYSPYSLEVVFARPIRLCLSSFRSRGTVVAVLF